MGFGELESCLPSPIFGRGAGGEGKDLSTHWRAPSQIIYKLLYTYQVKVDYCI